MLLEDSILRTEVLSGEISRVERADLVLEQGDHKILEQVGIEGQVRR